MDLIMNSSLNDTLRRAWRPRTLLSTLMAGSLLAVTPACGLGGDGDGEEPERDPSLIGRTLKPIQPTPPSGQTSFYSADGQNGQATEENNERGEYDNLDASAPGADAGAEDRVAEEGDIYRVVNGSSEQLILNLNRYRGLQIIDFSDADDPEVIGKVSLSGTPVEMYQVGDKLFVLLNDWYSYWYNSRYAQKPQSHYGGGVVVVDISDRHNPTILSQAHVDGWISTSRLTRGGDKEALYVVSSQWHGGGETVVSSFAVDEAGAMNPASTIELGGSVQDIQATGSRLIISRYNYQNGQGGSQISLIDISSPDGVMVEGGAVEVEGRVRTKFNLDLEGDVLRVVSSNSWSSSSNTNHVQTFDASDIQNLAPLDSETFGDNEDLYATLFMEDRAFFVTYRRVDPFHAFSIAPDGTLKEESEFIISGWNDYFSAVSQRSRLIGIGKNDENGRNTMAVSLYDVTDLSNPSPLITRAEVALDQSWSEAQWDDRAFSVLEKATNVLAPDGVTTETGLVLLPFSGWNESEKRYISAVQVFTFSKDTLTLRGTMEHGSHVRRSFLADRASHTAANLSEAELSLYNVQNPDAPAERGRVELAPNYASFLTYGSYGVRHHDRNDHYGWWGSRAQGARQDSLQIVPLSAPDVDHAEPVATIDIPAHATLHQAGDKLVVVSTTYIQPEDQGKQGAEGSWETEIQVWDMTHPAIPTLQGTLVTDRLEGWGGGYYGGGWGWEDCWDCGRGYYGYGGEQEAFAAGDALVFPRYVQQQRLLGTLKTRYIRPADGLQRRWDSGCYEYSYDEDGQYAVDYDACNYYEGGVTCSTLTRVSGEMEPESCQGEIFFCTQDDLGERECETIEPSVIATEERVHEREHYRSWRSLTLDVLDLSDGLEPRLTDAVALPIEEEYVGLVAEGETLYVSVKLPHEVDGDSRPYVKHHVRAMDLSSPALATLGARVNVPGQLLDVQGSSWITQDTLWGEKIVEASIDRLEVHSDGLAYLQSVRRFEDQLVDQVVRDEAGHLLIDHRLAWYAHYSEHGYDWEEYDSTSKLTLVDMQSDGFESVVEMEVDSWATLKGARAGKALYQVPGGLLVVDLQGAQGPQPQSYFPLQGWPRDIRMEGDTVYLSAGQYGLYQFDLNETNLPQLEE